MNAAEYRTLEFSFYLLSIGLTLSSLEYLSLTRVLRGETFLSWDILKLRPGYFRFRLWHGFLDYAFSYPNIRFLLGVRVTAAALGSLALAARADLSVIHVLIIINLLLHFLITIRFPVGSEGADQVAHIILLSFSLCLFLDDKTLAMRIAASFISAQLSLAYITSGVAKLGSPQWRNGTALLGIMSTRSFGSPLASKILATSPHRAMLFSYPIMGFLIVAPFLLFAQGSTALMGVCLALGLLFHFTTALLMGLNCFLWNFVSMYPSAFLCATLFWSRAKDVIP